MIAICIDDEPILLDWLVKSVNSSPDITNTISFTDETAALDYVSSEHFDIAFIDVELHTMDGITVAERLRAINPNCGIIFCTGHASYAVDAIKRVEVNGYLIKPIDRDEVQREIDRYKNKQTAIDKLLAVDMSHGFDVFDKNGAPVRFARTKTNDLLAILIEQNGVSITADDLCKQLWDDSSSSRYLLKKNKNYLTQLLTDLRHTLDDCKASDVLKRTDDGYAVCMPLIKLVN